MAPGVSDVERLTELGNSCRRPRTVLMAWRSVALPMCRLKEARVRWESFRPSLVT